MHYPGSLWRRCAAGLVLAIACAVLAPSTAGADTVSLAPQSPNTDDPYGGFVQGLTGDLFTRKARVVVTYDGLSHLAPGSQVTVPGFTQEDWTIEPTTLQIPAGWGVGGRVEADAILHFQTQLPIQRGSTTLHWPAPSYACGPIAIGDGDCLTWTLEREMVARINPHPVPSVAVDPGVSDADVTWEPSPDHAVIAEYVITRVREVQRDQVRQVFQPKDPRSFHDTGLDPETGYCYRVQAVYRSATRGDAASQNPVEYCGRTGHNPPAPGAGVDGPALDGDGDVDLTWGASAEPGVRYDVDHSDASGDWTRLATGVTETSYAAHEAEGTWAYRVRSTNSHRGASAWVESPARVKVDLSAPNPPAAATDPADPASAVGGWFKDSVTVSFADAGDRELVDGSAGSGVVSHSGSQTFDTDGDHTAAGTATDAAGHESQPTTKTVKVDATAPTVAIVCPDVVQQGADASATWNAEDGQSGLAGAAAGSVALDTSTPGHHPSPAAPAPRDNVGHTGAGDVTCTYEVNAPPHAPGTPAGPALTRDGTFDVNWDAATDPDGDTVAYEIQQRDADDDWSAAAAADTAQYRAHVPNDGTWSFRVRALDGRGGESAWVTSTDATKFDDSAPTAPGAVTDPPAPVADSGGWFKDRVSVAWGGSSDPALHDGSAGSGVASYSAERAFDSDGEHSHSGTATDAAGNESDSADATVKVDASKPRAAITCPVDRLAYGAGAQADWTAADDESGLATPAAGSVDLDTATPGTKTATAPTARDAVGHESDAATCRYEVLPPNSAPGAPGSPNGPAADRDGDLQVTWTAADDPDAGDAPSYVLEKRDADDTAWSSLAEGLTAPHADVHLANGTWTFRVKAVDSHGAATDWVESSSATVVDGGKPTAPVATTDPGAPAPAAGGWFKDSVKVKFDGSSDPVLTDGSAGSGVASYSGARTFDTEGTHTATGTATDRAGNESDATSKTVKVDATAPSTRISCPSEALIVGQPGANATWSASDSGSGLATPATGSVALNTATAGVRTATAPAARDNVGHAGDAATCEYEVRYRFTGGVAPVEGSNVINVGRRGRTYPVRWRLTRANGALISDAEGTALARTMSANDTKVTCTSFLSQSQDGLEEETGLPSPSLRYDTSKNWFVYSYRAPAAGCFTLDVHRADGLNTKRWRFLFLP